MMPHVFISPQSCAKLLMEHVEEWAGDGKGGFE